MARKVAFKQADVSRAVKGAVGAGLAVARVEIGQDGRIVIITPGGAPAEPKRELDEWRRSLDHPD